MTATERLRAHPRVREIVESDDEVIVRLANGDEHQFFGDLDTVAAEMLADIDGDDA